VARCRWWFPRSAGRDRLAWRPARRPPIGPRSAAGSAAVTRPPPGGRDRAGDGAGGAAAAAAAPAWPDWRSPTPGGSPGGRPRRDGVRGPASTSAARAPAACRTADHWPATPARASARARGHSAAAGPAPRARGRPDAADSGWPPCDASRWPGSTRPTCGRARVCRPARSADATPRHIHIARGRSRRLLSGAFGNTGFEAPPFVSVTFLLRAIASLK
jgi:hypothetical protein